MAKRLSRKERTLSAVQPPISGGSISRRFRSTLRLVSLASLPRERGRACTEKGEREEGLEAGKSWLKEWGRKGTAPRAISLFSTGPSSPFHGPAAPANVRLPKGWRPPLFCTLYSPPQPHADSEPTPRAGPTTHHPPSAGSL